MQVSSRVTIDTIAIDNLCDLAKEALVQTAEALHTEVQNAQVVPRDKGTLQNEAMFVDKSQADMGRVMGRVSIVHDEPYARRLYFHPEYKFHRASWISYKTNASGRRVLVKHDGNPNARAHWFEDWQEGGKHEDFCRKKFKFYYKRLLRGAGR